MNAEVLRKLEEHHWSYRQQQVTCSKPNCTKLHGPYWYAFRKKEGRTVSLYVGKKLPPRSVLGQVDHVRRLDGRYMPAAEIRKEEELEAVLDAQHRELEELGAKARASIKQRRRRASASRERTRGSTAPRRPESGPSL